MHTVNPGVTGLPRDLEVMQAYDKIDAAFPGDGVPAVTVVKAADVTTPEVQGAIDDLQREAIATGKLHKPVDVDISDDKTVATVALAVDGTGTDAASERSLAVLRDQVVPATVGQLDGAEVAVTGFTAGSKDFNDVMKSHLPIVFAFVLTLAFILLLVTFRSIVVPIKAIILNLLSVGAAYGILKLVFQDGRLEGFLDYESVGGITSWLPLFLFVILFGLSMDYHVFILSRIREAVDGGMRTDKAVAHGIKSTAGVVTSAAAVMVAVFAIFATLSMLEFKMMGVGLAVAILIDATLVRAVLLPATMKLLGDWNWYLPKKLDWLPKFSHEPPSRAPRRSVARDDPKGHEAPVRLVACVRDPIRVTCRADGSHRSAHRRRRLPRPQRGHPRDRPQGHQHPRARVRRLPLRLGRRPRRRRDRPHAPDHQRHPAPRRHDPRHVAHERVQGGERARARAGVARARSASTR